ncbi:hypothetical protein B843_12695 [Corynebacterium vitaeruminis DSM 20294]|uniref:Uncharacterized protein n=2 Tax=Corynebacterium vitaeruminis TaxID=38305 RepID=W5Y501_9CORY|nr:hypothetical protein B843_12695 [Corynebacterium vitaeruminis DSM 20294]
MIGKVPAGEKRCFQVLVVAFDNAFRFRIPRRGLFDAHTQRAGKPDDLIDEAFLADAGFVIPESV